MWKDFFLNGNKYCFVQSYKRKAEPTAFVFARVSFSFPFIIALAGQEHNRCTCTNTHILTSHRNTFSTDTLKQWKHRCHKNIIFLILILFKKCYNFQPKFNVVVIRIQKKISSATIFGIPLLQMYSFSSQLEVVVRCVCWNNYPLKMLIKMNTLFEWSWNGIFKS